MDLIKIFGTNLTGYLNLDMRYRDIRGTLNKKEKVNEILSLIKYIDQPLNMDYSSLLQLACMYALDTKIVEYLLQKGANPNYLDINGMTARGYVDDNAYSVIRNDLRKLLDSYKEFFPEEDVASRRRQGWNFLEEEILRHTKI